MRISGNIIENVSCVCGIVGFFGTIIGGLASFLIAGVEETWVAPANIVTFSITGIAIISLGTGLALMLMKYIAEKENRRKRWRR